MTRFILLKIFHAILIVAFFSGISACTPQVGFQGDLAYEHVLSQIHLGPRTPGSEAHDHVIEYISNELLKHDWVVEIQQGESFGHPIRNIIAKKGNGTDWVILGAHYDSRLIADEDIEPDNRLQPVPGANDGASGVAVLLELARVIPDSSGKEIWLVFFDAEDQGRIPGWDWILGSRYFAKSLTSNPDAVVIVDMIGDADLEIYREKSSDIHITDQIWSTAANLGFHSNFIDEEKFNLIDDHLPFIEAGIPTTLIIDFDYPYWHTLDDTADKVSPKSLEVVGMTLLDWITE